MDTGPVCESLGKMVTGAVRSGLADLHLKSAFVSKSSTVSRNWLPLGRAEWPKMAKCLST